MSSYAPSLLPGDCLLYKPSSLTGLIIAVKTWTLISHVEVYAGDGLSWASRDGIGVNRYPTRYSDLGVRAATVALLEAALSAR